MNKYLNKKVMIYEKLFDSLSSDSKKITWNYNVCIGIITDVIDNKFIELDNKVLISIDYIYRIEIVQD